MAVFRVVSFGLIITFFVGCTSGRLVADHQGDAGRLPADDGSVQLNCRSGGSSTGAFKVTSQGGEFVLKFIQDVMRQDSRDYISYQSVGNNIAGAKFVRSQSMNDGSPVTVTLPKDLLPPISQGSSTSDVLIDTVSNGGVPNARVNWQCNYSRPMYQ